MAALGAEIRVTVGGLRSRSTRPPEAADVRPNTDVQYI